MIDTEFIFKPLHDILLIVKPLIFSTFKGFIFKPLKNKWSSYI